MHNNWEELIPFYVAGTLPRSDTTRLENHLARCADCRRSLGEWRLIAGVVRADAASQLRDLPPLSHQVVRVAHQQGEGRRYQSSALAAAQPVTRYNATSITLVAAFFTVILFGGLLAFMVLRGMQPPNTGVVLLSTDTPTTAPSGTALASPTPLPGSPTPQPQIIVIEPSETPVSPTPAVLTPVTPTPSPTRVIPTRILPTRALPTTAPPASETPADLQAFSIQLPSAQTDACTIHTAIPGSVVGIQGGPGENYPTLSTFAGDDELTVLGVTSTGWYRVEYPPGSDLGAGWVQREQVYMSGTCDSVPLIAVAAQPVTPTNTVLPFPTDTPSPTPAATETPPS